MSCVIGPGLFGKIPQDMRLVLICVGVVLAAGRLLPSRSSCDDNLYRKRSLPDLGPEFGSRTRPKSNEPH